MSTLILCIENLRAKLDRYQKQDLKEIPTRTILIDPLLETLGWDIRDPDEVELEYQTIDGKSVDYALKINHKPVLFIEAKPLNDTLTDIKSIAQIVSYAANAGIEWCILTNGVTYKVYRSTEKAEAPEKLLFEMSFDPKETEGMPIQQIAERFQRISREATANKLLDDIGEQIFTMTKVRKALDKLFMDPPQPLIRLIRSTIGDNSIKPQQVKKALERLWTQTSEISVSYIHDTGAQVESPDITEPGRQEYSEEYHIDGKPREIIELYRSIDKFCRELDPLNVKRKFLKTYVRYSHEKNIFCCVHILKSALRVWIKVKYTDLDRPPEYVRDVTNTGHYGVGDVELGIDSLEKFQNSRVYIQRSFEENKSE
ncbi:MAG: type I restriction enzyme HsdR N-terminal domain-containing protein [Theionarchaea archaeon]|nr:type I restriction enzyme HsdR N-terminal domain-containing protein [Theionarchaea archaeon]